MNSSTPSAFSCLSALMAAKHLLEGQDSTPYPKVLIGAVIQASVVESVVSLTSSLAVKMLTVLVSTISSS